MSILASIRSPSWLSALALAAIVLGGFGLNDYPRVRSGATPALDAMAQWRDQGHNWLLVADGKADELVVYNATNGRPLHRIKIEHGLQNVDALVQRDGHLFLIDAAGKREEISLPQLRVASVDGH
ncbi:MAG: hypothetical protein EPN74_13960 [Rhodanobacter sp.]|nr:MAG: hypothetical protein EPN74_13960 [Rhodanobacter sp.]